jgi:murein DD-endopeptidase MepM/ murein hydrolase activator NlpD
VNTSYLHLDSIAVKEGQSVRAGEKIGTLGATGRATGPHLHWGLNWFDVRLDPALIVPPMPAAK